MKLLITIPSFGAHGGLNVIIQWANRLTRWHDVHLYVLNGKPNTSWCKLNDKVKVCGPEMIWHADCIILTSPHSSFLLDLVLPWQKCFLFLQMMEDMFNPSDVNWMNQCKKFYQSKYPMFSISQWNIDRLAKTFGRTGPDDATAPGATHYIGSGIDTDQFPLNDSQKDGKTILIEGWQPGNPSKDADMIGPKVAERLKRDGYRIIAYSGLPLKTYRHVPHEYYCKPDLKKLNELYTRATILIKATRYDARACAPVEAMTKGTVTARAIIAGDDDLINDRNCLRCDYSEEPLCQISLELMKNHERRERLRLNCLQYVEESLNWDAIIERVNEILMF